MKEELFGRDVELAALDAFVADCVVSGGTLVLQGEAGIGKTSLWRAALELAAEHGFRVLSCRPAPAEVKLSFAGLEDLLGAIPVEALDTLPQIQRQALEAALLRVDVASAAEPRSVAAAVRSLLVWLAERSPVLVAVDDLQWLDSASAAALGYALRRLSGAPVGILVARRPPEDDRMALGLEHAQVIEVERLTLAAIHELLKRRLGVAFPRPLLLRVYETAGGNPFYALEIGRELRDTPVAAGAPLPVAKDLRRLVRRRLGRLSRPTREALLVASAVDEPTSMLLEQVLGNDPSDALDEAERAEVIEVSGDTIRFSHPLYASAIYSGAQPARRRQVHARIAAAVSDVEGRASHLALAAAEPSEPVASALDEAAEVARQRGASSVVAVLLEQASRMTPPEDQDGRQRRLLAAATAHFDSADTASARRILDTVVPSMPPGRDRAHALMSTALLRHYDVGPGPAREALSQALEDARGDSRLEAEIHVRISFVSSDDLELSARSAARARELIGNDPEAADDLTAAALLEDAYMRFLAGKGLAHEQVRRAEALLPLEARSWLAQRADAALKVWTKYTDRLVDARRLYEHDAVQRRLEGDEYEASLIECHLAEVECWLGNWQRAREHAEASAAVIEASGNRLWYSVTLYDRALIAAHRGDVDEAREAAHAGLALAEEAADVWIAVLHLSVLGFIDLSVGDLAGAAATLDRAEQEVVGIGLREPARFRFDADHVEAVVGLGELARAEELVAALRRRVAVTPRPWLLVVAKRSEALLQAARGDLDAALQSAGQAIVEHERLPMPFELGRTLLVKGQIERRAKQKAAAKGSLSRALATFEELGAPLWAAKARAELSRVGLRPPARDDLTETERQVAELAASGLKNREVAARLFMSPKTVDANLARVYRKLGIRSRAELGARLAGS